MTLSSLRNFDESIIREQVLSTHNHDCRNFNTNFILSIVENILSFKTGTAQEPMVEKLNQLEELNYKELSCHMRQLSFEIASGLKNANQHSTIIHVLSILCSYSWEDKLVLMLAAFAIIYGELRLVSQFCERKGLARNLEKLKQTPSDNQKAIVDCISSAIELTKCVVELKRWQSYSPPELVILALPMASYWIGASVVNCAACAYGAHFKFQNELGELTTSIASIQAIFSPELAKKKADESFDALRYALYHNSSNRLEVFRLMFNVKDNYEQLFCDTGLHDWEDHREVLLLITSGFDISNERIDFLNWFYFNSKPHIIWIPMTENVNAAWTTEDEQQFAKLKQRMWFYWLNDPQKMMLPQFKRFVREELFQDFHMGEEPIIVSVNLLGRIVHPNVMHMILTWAPPYIQENTIGVQRLSNITPLIVNELKEGTSGVSRVIPEIDKIISDFVRDIDYKIKDLRHLVEAKIQKVIAESTPYDNEREKFLWQQETGWSLHLVAPKFGPCGAFGELIANWISQEKYIFLYGGNDIKWVRDFTSKVREVGSNTQLKIELAYVGKNKMIRDIIIEEGLSYCALDESNQVWQFWTRIRSMFLSRIRYLNAINHFDEECKDEIFQGLEKLLAYEGKNTTIEGWALLSKGKKMVMCGHGAKMLRVINEYDIWKKNLATKGFDQAFKDHHKMFDSSSSSLKSHSCCALEYTSTVNKIPKNEKCPECSCRMHKFVTFTCCHGHDIDSNF